LRCACGWHRECSMRDDLPTMGEDLRVHLRHDHGTEEITVDLVVTPHEGESVGSPWARWW
jgi:hypothetical protein